MSPEQLQEAFGIDAARAQLWAQPLTDAMALFGIDTPQRRAGFLAQIGHESGRLKYVREVWGPTPAQLRYQGRKDLGNLRPGDGIKYLGRGPMQITGHANYMLLRDDLRKLMPNVPDFEQSPELVETPKWGALAAAWYWHRNNLNRFADAGDIDGMSDAVNIGHKTAAVGDSNGYADRLALWNKLKAIA